MWGPRKTGKSTYLNRTFPDSIVFGFLKTDLMLDFISFCLRAKDRAASIFLSWGTKSQYRETARPSRVVVMARSRESTRTPSRSTW